MSEPILSVDNLSAGYGDIKVLSEIGLRVRPGEITAVLGANGAGKTTLLSAIAGVITPSAGSVVLNGVDVTRNRSHKTARLGLAFVQEGKRVFHRRTVRENLLLGGLTIPRGERMRRLDAMTEMFPMLAETSGKRAAQLSGGQQQMLAIAQALMPDPEVVMLDEPSAGLAPVIVKAVWATVDQLRAEGKAVLLVEQLVTDTLRLADHVVVLDRGRVAIDRPGADVDEHEVKSIYLGNVAH